MRSRSMLAYGAVVCGLLVGLTTTAAAQADIIVADIPDTYNWGSANNIAAFSCGTNACNVGNANMSWDGNNNQHPVIAENMFRLKAGRMEQLGQAWVKHGFASANWNYCAICQSPGLALFIGVGCSDPYGNQQNGIQTDLAPKSEVNAANGYFPIPWNNTPAIPPVTGRRLQAHHSDLDPTLNAGAVYFIEVQYVAPGDIGQNFNNASYRRVNVTPNGSSYDISFTSAYQTQQRKPAIEAWRDLDPSVAISYVDVPGDGRFIMGFKETDNGNGTAHYEYAVHNLCSDRALQAFSVAMPAGAVVTNAGFHDVDYHSNEPGGYSLTDWTPTVAPGSITWATSTYAVNPAANALRWGTMYNYRFDSDQPPGQVTFTLFKPGVPAAMVVPAQPYLGAAATGDVGANAGGPYNVFTINGSTGGLARRVEVGVGQPITLAVSQPPMNALPSQFAIFGLFGIPSVSASYALPIGIGNSLFVPCPLDPFNPTLFVLADNFPIGGCAALLPSTAAPWTTTAPGGVAGPIDVTLQGVIRDITAPSTYAVTNGVILRVN